MIIPDGALFRRRRRQAEKLPLAARCKSVHVNEWRLGGKCRSRASPGRSCLGPRCGKLANDKVIQYLWSASSGLFVWKENRWRFACSAADVHLLSLRWKRTVIQGFVLLQVIVVRSSLISWDLISLTYSCLTVLEAVCSLLHQQPLENESHRFVRLLLLLVSCECVCTQLVLSEMSSVDCSTKKNETKKLPSVFTPASGKLFVFNKSILKWILCTILGVLFLHSFIKC